MLPKNAFVEGRVGDGTAGIVGSYRILDRTKQVPNRVVAISRSDEVFLDPLRRDWVSPEYI
jgi:hypothetical protein